MTTTTTWTAQDVAARQVPSPTVKVKAAGGVRTLDSLTECLDAGIDSTGASATAAIIDDLRARENVS